MAREVDKTGGPWTVGCPPGERPLPCAHLARGPCGSGGPWSRAQASATVARRLGGTQKEPHALPIRRRSRHPAGAHYMACAVRSVGSDSCGLACTGPGLKPKSRKHLVTYHGVFARVAGADLAPLAPRCSVRQ